MRSPCVDPISTEASAHFVSSYNNDTIAPYASLLPKVNERISPKVNADAVSDAVSSQVS